MKNLSIQQNAGSFSSRVNLAAFYVLSLLLTVLLWPFSIAYAQAPNITYTTPQVYNAGVAIDSLSPSNTGGAVPLPGTVTIGGGNVSAVAVDVSGNIYAAVGNNDAIVEIFAGGGAESTLVSSVSSRGLAVDASGNVYYTKGNTAIYKLPAGNTSSQIVASGLATPYGLAIDAVGNLYFSEFAGADVKEIPAGTTTPVTIASGFKNPAGIAVDAAGNVYVAEENNNAIKEIVAGSGNVATLVTGSAGTYFVGVAVDSFNNVYFVSGNTVVTERPVSGGSNVVVGSGFYAPDCLAVDRKGNIFVGNSGNGPNGGLLQEIPAGGYQISPALPAGLNFNTATGVISGTPTAAAATANYTVTATNKSGSSTAVINITVNVSAKPIISYTTPQVYNAGVAINPLSPTNTGGVLPTPTPVVLAQGSEILGLAVDAAGNLYIGDDAGQLSEIPVGGGSPVVLVSNIKVVGVAVDAAGNIYYTRQGDDNIYEINAGGAEGTVISGQREPRGLAIDAAGNLYYSEAAGGDIKEIPTGSTTPVVIATGFSDPEGIAIDAAGNIYVADSRNQAVKKILAGSRTVVTLVAGISPGSVYGVAVDTFGNVYFVSIDNTVVTEIPVGGGSNVIVGSGFYNTASIAVDSKGNIFIGNYSNVGDETQGLIQKIPTGGYTISPLLPAGLSLNAYTGVISGTPTAPVAAANYTVTATNSSGSSTAVINIAVNVPAKPIISYSTPQTYTVPGAAITPLTPVSSGGPSSSFSINPALPAGLSFDSNTGIISGSPQAASPATNYSVTATNGGGSDTAVISITVNTSNPIGFSYSSPQVYHPLVPITPLAPQNAGAIPGPNPVTLGSLPVDIRGMAVDSTGSVYLVGTTSTGVTKLTGSTFVTLGSTLVHPDGVAVDRAGNVFVADSGHNAIKEIPAGSKTIVNYLFSINQPEGIAVDASGNLYVTSPGGVYKIPAGTKTPQLIGGNSTGITVDAAGNVYWCDISNKQIVEHSASSGQNIIVATGLASLQGIAIDAKGNIYYAQNDTVIMELPAGGGTAFPVVTGLVNAVAVAADRKGNVFTESGGNTILEMPFGMYSIAPTLPRGLTFDPETGIISGTPTVITPAATYTVIGSNAGGSGAATVNIAVTAPAKPNIGYNTPQTLYINKPALVSPSNSGGAVPAQHPLTIASGILEQFGGIKVDGARNIYVVVSGNTAIYKYPPGGGTPALVGAGLDEAGAIALDGAGNVFVDDGNGTIQEIRVADGSTVNYATGFSLPQGVAVDAAGNVYVSDNTKNALYKIPPGGGTPVEIAAGLNGPTRIAIDAAGDIFIANTKGNNIRELPAGASTTIVFATGFNNPTDVAVDAAGNVFVADQGNAVIKRIPAGGGTPVVVAQSVTFQQPQVIALDANNNIYVGDFGAKAIYEINPGYLINTVLPPGLSMDENTGIISGTPTTKSAAKDYTVTAYNSGGSSTAVVNLKVVAGSNTSLSGLSASRGVLSPAFNTSTTAYTVSVANTATSISFTPTTSDGTAVVTINGTSVSSGTASPLIPLSVGANNIHVLVDDNGGTTEANYTVTVNRATSANANLSSFKLSKGNITPGFSGTTYNYNVTVANTVTSITVTPTAAGAGATITVNGTAVTSGTASAPIDLNIGNNTISIVVTASDGTTTQTYTLTVNHPGATNASLSGFKISRGVLTPVFQATTTAYTAGVVNGVSSMTVTPTTGDPNATVTVNGTAVVSGSPSDAIALSVGANTITTIITAQDGVTTKTYTLTVTRAAGNTDSFVAGISVQTPTDTPPLNDDIIFVHQGVSPNGDGVNDFLIIDGIQAYPDNKLSIMNRNGQLIYEASGYDNSSKMFDGHSNKNGRMQLPGTYFYQLDYSVKGITKHKTGFIVLKY